MCAYVHTYMCLCLYMCNYENIFEFPLFKQWRCYTHFSPLVRPFQNSLQISHFLQLHSIPLCGSTMVYLTRLLLMDVGYFLSFTKWSCNKKLMYISFPIFISVFLEYIPRSGLAESKCKCIFNLLDIAKFFSIALETLCIPIDNIQEPDSPQPCRQCMSTNLDGYQSDE